MTAVVTMANWWTLCLTTLLCLTPVTPIPCTTGNYQHTLETLPGGGWDNLRNVDMGQVAVMTYNQCDTTEDALYLIPDGIFVVPLKHSQLETFGEVIEHWSNYTSMTSSTINLGASFFSVISGSFSYEHQSIKKHQVNDKSITTRVMLRHRLYRVRLQPDVQLHPKFKARLMDVASYYSKNNTQMADYLLQLIVRDYGTHVVTSVEAGAILAQVDQVKNTFFSNYWNQKSDISASASASFFGKVGLSAGFSHSTSQTFIDEYLTNRTHSRVMTYGGPPYGINFTVNDWEKGLGNSLVAIDRAGDPLYYIITSENMPELPIPLLLQVIGGLEKNIRLYYKFNTIHGCTKQDSKNFNFQANLDDGSCKPPNTNYTFGGVYQTCTMTRSGAGDLCKDLLQKNPLSGGYSCPTGYQSVFLHEGVTARSFKRRECHESCDTTLFIFTHCDTVCGDVYYSSSAIYHAYWCVNTGTVEQDSGFLFGGLYSKMSSNPITKTQGCPIRYYPLHMGENMKVCVSDDYELGYQYSLPFAGFFSCKTGNPLVFNSQPPSKKTGEGSLTSYFASEGSNSWPHRCPTGYSEHLATVDQGCEINFCVRVNSLSDQGLPEIRRPPFIPLPGIMINETDLVYIIGPSSRVWIKNETTSRWSQATFSQLEQLQTANNKGRMTTKSKTNGGQIAGITIGCTAAVGILLVVAIFGWRKYKRSKSLYREMSTGFEYGTCQNHQQREVKMASVSV